MVPVLNSNSILQLIKECAEGSGLDIDTYSSILKNALLDVIKNKYGDEAEKYFEISINLDKDYISLLAFKEIVSNKETNLSYNKIKLSDALKIESDFKIGETCAVEFGFDKFTRDDITNLRSYIATYVQRNKSLIFCKKYEKLNGKIVNATVHLRCNGYYLLKDEENYELILPFKEMISNETFRKRQYVKVVVKDVTTKNLRTIVTVSRVDSTFLRKLLEYEISEIQDGIIEIKNIARIAGIKSKVIVESYSDHIDPIKTCVGVKGTIVNKISRELNGEYIDFIKYSENFNEYLARILSIPSVQKIKQLENNIFVYVNENYIGLAIGKDGVNIKLVKMLLNTNVDVFVYNEVLDSSDVLPVEILSDAFHSWIITTIKSSGFDTLESILNVPKEIFEKKTDFELETIDEIYKLAEKYIKEKEK